MCGNHVTFIRPDGVDLSDRCPPQPAVDGLTELLRHWELDDIDHNTAIPDWDGRRPRLDEWSNTIHATLVQEGVASWNDGIPADWLTAR